MLALKVSAKVARLANIRKRPVLVRPAHALRVNRGDMLLMQGLPGVRFAQVEVMQTPVKRALLVLLGWCRMQAAPLQQIAKVRSRVSLGVLYFFPLV